MDKPRVCKSFDPWIAAVGVLFLVLSVVLDFASKTKVLLDVSTAPAVAIALAARWAQQIPSDFFAIGVVIFGVLYLSWFATFFLVWPYASSLAARLSTPGIANRLLMVVVSQHCVVTTVVIQDLFADSSDLRELALDWPLMLCAYWLLYIFLHARLCWLLLDHFKVL